MGFVGMGFVETGKGKGSSTTARALQAMQHHRRRGAGLPHHRRRGAGLPHHRRRGAGLPHQQQELAQTDLINLSPCF